VLCYVLDGILKLLHPFMPFITEEIYSSLPHAENATESIMIAKYPEYDATMLFEQDAENMGYVIDAIRAIRNRRSEMNIVPSRRAKVYIETKYADAFPATVAVFFERLASASEVAVAASFEGQLNVDETVQIVTSAATVYLPLSDIIDMEKEKARLNSERVRLEGEIARVEQKLSNESFVAKAPAAVVDAERAKLAKYKENLDGVLIALTKIK
jgi:valyl-tRNA synthetase